MHTETIERAARLAFEAMRLRAEEVPDLEPWERQPEALREDWRAVAREVIDAIPGAAIEAHYIIGIDTYVICDREHEDFVILPNDLGRAVDALTAPPAYRNTHDGAKLLRPWPPAPGNLK